MLIVNEVKNVAVLEERIEEYILQGITEEFNPTFNEDLVNADATNTDMNIGDESIISNGNFFPFLMKQRSRLELYLMHQFQI